MSKSKREPQIDRSAGIAAFAVGTPASRAAVRAWLERTQQTFQVIICGMNSAPFDPADCEVNRYRLATGEIIEMIMVGCDIDQISEEEYADFQRLIRSTPIRNSSGQSDAAGELKNQCKPML